MLPVLHRLQLGNGWMLGAMPQALFGAYYSQWHSDACPLSASIRSGQSLAGSSIICDTVPPRSQSRIDMSTKWLRMTTMNYVMDARSHAPAYIVGAQPTKLCSWRKVLGAYHNQWHGDMCPFSDVVVKPIKFIHCI